MDRTTPHTSVWTLALIWLLAALIGLGEAVAIADDPVADEVLQPPNLFQNLVVRPLLQLDSPQATMGTFLRAIGEANRGFPIGYDDTLACFDLSGVAPNTAKQRAQMLLDTINRLGKINVADLPDKSQIELAAQYDGIPAIQRHHFPLSRTTLGSGTGWSMRPMARLCLPWTIRAAGNSLLRLLRGLNDSMTAW